MKRLAILLVLAAALGPPALAQRTHYITPDVPTDDPGGSGTVFMPWDVLAYKAGVYTPFPVISLPPPTAVDAIHKMDRPGTWLISVESPAELPPGSGVFFRPEDVFVYDGSNFILYFDGTANGVPAGTNVDAVFLERDDFGDLILSFDVPTTIGANTYEPSDLVRFSGGAFSLYLDGSATGSGIALSDNVTGADSIVGLDVLPVDVPSDLLPSTGPTTYLPGQIPAWDAGPATFLLYDTLGGWPISTEVDGFSCQANPGRVYERSVYPFPITMDKSPFVPGDVIVRWLQSCSSGVEDYGIYEGTLGSWYSHVQILCTDTGGDLQEDFTPAAVSSYYLVVPHDWVDEGAYGADHDYSRIPPRVERPRPALAADQCVPNQVLSPCP